MAIEVRDRVPAEGADGDHDHHRDQARHRDARNKRIEHHQQEQMRQMAAERKSMVGSGDRSEKIRTYNYPQNRVTDHRIGMSSHNLPAIMDGDLDEFIDELATREEAERLQAVGA